MKKFIIIAMSPVGDGLSGGDRIFIELARRAAKKNIATNIVTWTAGVKMAEKINLKGSENLKFIDLGIDSFAKFGFGICYIARILKGLVWAISYKVSKDNASTVLYSASDFWMDTIPAFILKMRYPYLKWAGTFYLAAPNPFKGYDENGPLKLPTMKLILYSLMQLPMYWLIRLFADFVFVTSDPDIRRFPSQAKKNKVIVIKGGVDLEKVKSFQDKLGRVEKKYDAFFLGRFHPQKGVLELIDIWREVVDILPYAKLVMIGDGPLMGQVREKIQKLGLEKNILLTGYLMDGIERFNYNAQSKLVLHPAIYDSGGMAAAEAMAWGLPAVSFDLEALKTYYSEGMVKVKLHDTGQFAKVIIDLLSNRQRYSTIQKQSIKLIENQWDWEKRAQDTLDTLYA